MISSDGGSEALADKQFHSASSRDTGGNYRGARHRVCKRASKLNDEVNVQGKACK